LDAEHSELRGNTANTVDAPVDRLADAAVVGALAIATTQAIQVLAATVQGLTLPRHGADGVTGGSWQRIGAGFAQSIGTFNAGLLLFAVVLAAVPVAVHASGRARRRMVQGAALAVCSAVASVIFVGGVLALRERVYQYDIAGRSMPATQHWSLFGYLAGTLGLSVIVLFAASTVHKHTKNS
jgi:hypothetical protein